MSQTRKKGSLQQSVKVQERQRAKAKQKTQRRLASFQRNLERSRGRSEKLAQRTLSNSTPSAANEAFAEGLESYEYYHDQQIVNTLLEKAQEKLEKLAPNRFYLLNRNRFLPLSLITEVNYFGVLYKDEYPENSYYYEFSEEEDYENNETHQVFYHFEVSEFPPHYYAILHGNVTSKLTRRQYHMLFNELPYSPSYHINRPLEFMMEDPRFAEQYEKSIAAKKTAPKKLKALREKGLAALVQSVAVKSGRNVGENVEGIMRSFI